MSSFGVNVNDPTWSSMRSSGSVALSGTSQGSLSGTSQGSLSGTSPGLNNFFHGMHSFQSAEELQFYLRQIGGPGSMVNITDAHHFNIVRTPTNMNQGTRSVTPLPLANSDSVVSVNGHDQPLSPVGGVAGARNSHLPPVLPGYERRNYLVVCELHRRENSVVHRTGFQSLASTIRQIRESGAGERINLVQSGPCEICGDYNVDYVIYPNHY